MRLRKIAVTSLVIVVGALGVMHGDAEEITTIKGNPVIVGDYKPLSVWDSISLGAAYFVNPQRAATSDVAYSFDGPEFSNKTDELWKLPTEGKISFGISKREGIKVESITVGPLSELQKVFPVQNAAELSNVLAKDNVYVIFNSQMLLGEASAMPLIKSTSAPTQNR